MTAVGRAGASIPDRTLALFVNDEIVRVDPVAVGKPSTPSPVGIFTIVNRVTYWIGGDARLHHTAAQFARTADRIARTGDSSRT